MSMNSFSISGNLVDVHQKKFYPAEIIVENGKIASITSNPKLQTSNYILPGFIDAHVHIESSMLVPSEFAKLAVVHGTVATVSDPHEIANVCGMEGVEFMIENGKTVPFKFNFGAPSCVPATIFETAGAALDTTDHECFTKEEALDKLQNGMKILIREGSAAKNFEALIDLLNDYPNQMMFCSDDKHPDSLVLGHINQLCERAIAKGINVYKVLKAACINPVLHYKLDVGLLKEGDAADFIVVKDLEKFEVLKTFINGELVAEG